MNSATFATASTCTETLACAGVVSFLTLIYFVSFFPSVERVLCDFQIFFSADDEFACMYYFKGYSPFSEGESNGVGTYLREIDSMVLYVTFFNSGSVILYPPLYSNVTAPDAPELVKKYC
jgi:hypothetical protein